MYHASVLLAVDHEIIRLRRSDLTGILWEEYMLKRLPIGICCVWIYLEKKRINVYLLFQLC